MSIWLRRRGAADQLGAIVVQELYRPATCGSFFFVNSSETVTDQPLVAVSFLGNTETFTDQPNVAIFF